MRMLTFVVIFRVNAKLHIYSGMIENSEVITFDMYYVPVYIAH